MNGWRQVRALARREAIMLSRQRIAFTMLVLVPLLQVLLYGYAVRPEASEVRVAIAGLSPQGAEDVAKVLDEKSGIRIVHRRLEPGGAANAVRRLEADIGIELPEQRTLANPFVKQLPARIVVDGTSSMLTAGAVTALEAAYWQEIVSRSDMAESGPGISIERLYNPDNRGEWTFLPGLIGVIAMISMTMLGSITLSRERESGAWEALAMLPCSRAVLLSGKLLPYVVVGSVQCTLVLLLEVLVFGLPLGPGVWALLVLAPLLSAAHLALGYLLSTRAASQLEALQGAVAFYLPAMLLSGFLYPFEALPGWAQRLGDLFPLTHFIRASQAATLRGDTAGAVFDHAWPMLLFLGVVLAIGVFVGRNRARV